MEWLLKIGRTARAFAGDLTSDHASGRLDSTRRGRVHTNRDTARGSDARSSSSTFL